MDELDALRRFRAPLAVPDAGARARVAARITRTPRVPVARIRRRRRVALIAVIAGAALFTAAVSGAANGLLSIVGVTTDATTTLPANGAGPSSGYIVGNVLHDAAGSAHRLSAAAAVGGLDDAVSSSSGQVIYAAGNPNVPDLRLFDPATESDRLLVTSALAPAWRSDGALAYAYRNPPAANTIGFATTVEVRPSPAASPVAWTGSGGYTPLAWAGDSLIVQRSGDDGIADILALSGPGQSKVLAHGAFLTLSPDGASILIARNAAPDGIPSSAAIELIDVASGAITESLDLGSVTPAGLETGVILPEGPGDWVGDRIVFPAPAGFVLLSAADGRLALDKVARFAGDPRLRGAEYHEARFANATGDRVTAKAIVVPPKGGQMVPAGLACDVVADHCTRGATVDDTSEFLTLVFNASRPTG